MKKALLCAFLLAVGLGFPVSLYLQRDTVSATGGVARSCGAVVSAATSAGEAMTSATAPPPLTGSDTWDRIASIRKGQQVAGTKYEEMLHLILNNPECFSPEAVASAQTHLRQLTH